MALMPRKAVPKEIFPAEEILNMAERNELLVDHYHKTFELTSRLWEQRNRLFLLLIGVIGLATVLTYSETETNSLFVDLVIKALGIEDSSRIAELKSSFPFALLHSILLLVVFYLMFNLYHRAVSVLMQYAYLGALEMEIREALMFNPGTRAFTRESDFYWSQRPKLLGSVKWVYIGLLGLLLGSFLVGRIIDDWRAHMVLFVFIDLIVGIPTAIYFWGYAATSIELDSKDAIIPKSGRAGGALKEPFVEAGESNGFPVLSVSSAAAPITNEMVKAALEPPEEIS